MYTKHINYNTYSAITHTHIPTNDPYQYYFCLKCFLQRSEALKTFPPF